ncbi:MAG TPA: SOS response-associated peptidase [Ktedonobacteraceae bacterium]|nr:SOS response-associated peptidase [Ktedonobacteraceae bacterium]
MCGRFALTVDLADIAKKFGVEPTTQAMHSAPRYNVAPTQPVAAVLRNGETHLAELRWGLIPSWAKDESIGARMINARAETLTEKPSFKGLLRSKRCMILADGFFEWKQEPGGKTPMFITMADGQPFAFAGLWDSWKSPSGEPLRTCTIITTQPNELVATIHDRMPAILLPEAYESWLDPSIKDEQLLSHWLAPYPAEAMMARPVSRLVNDPKNDRPEVLS